MFEVAVNDDGVIRLIGRCDAASSYKLERVLEQVDDSAIVDFGELTYISSDPLGVMFVAQKRLIGRNKGLTLVNLSPHIREVFGIAGFDKIFTIEEEEGGPALET
jgi:anti-anti-sigma factor